MNKDKIKRVFGVEMPHWEDQLRMCLVELAKQQGDRIRSGVINVATTPRPPG